MVRNLGPLENFFENYSYTFSYDSTESATSEFHRLCRVMSWERDDPEQKEAYEEFRDALVMEFNENFGTDANDLTSWQALCAAVRIDHIPDSLAEARRAMLDIHVNLVDLTDGVDPAEILLFPTEKALSEYTISTHKIFPRENVHSGSLLKELLRHIFNPSSASTRVHRGRGSGRYRRSRY
ncbi:hypothetical protein EST38_g8055 [Candolleomyces aberdarensis]|uniref:Uncharacterized protein n=1 Tax=Candolleomyces aberdarensis TaxID=2316362 RepID=A0A4Q2DGD1_9AGAR|nr:hypothetical protein EST38_g8055 [Candolleomyces aberdarensis]